MTSLTVTARKLYDHALRVVHPLVGSLVPVTYTSSEVVTQKRRLDPTGARSRRDRNADADVRIGRLVSVFDVDPARLDAFLSEARRVELTPLPQGDERDLASPMCFEDRFTMYVVTRVVVPRIVVETGVAHGVSSAYILAALEASGRGSLTSIELIDDDARIGRAVPPALRSRWKLLFGDSLDLLPTVLKERGPIDMFVHDSLHAYRHARREFELAWPHLAPGGVLCAHDILENNAFPRFVRRHGDEIGAWATGINLGLIRKRS